MIKSSSRLATWVQKFEETAAGYDRGTKGEKAVYKAMLVLEGKFGPSECLDELAALKAEDIVYCDRFADEHGDIAVFAMTEAEAIALIKSALAEMSPPDRD